MDQWTDSSLLSQMTESFSGVTSALRKRAIIQKKYSDRPLTSVVSDVDILASKFVSSFEINKNRLVPDNPLKLQIWNNEHDINQRLVYWPLIFCREDIQINCNELYRTLRNIYAIIKDSNDITLLLNKNLESGRPIDHLIIKDTLRTDRTLPFYESVDSVLKMIAILHCSYDDFYKSTEYVQGMSDLLSPILVRCQHL